MQKIKIAGIAEDLLRGEVSRKEKEDTNCKNF